MARPEHCKPHKVISSGRLISSGREPVRKKKLPGKQQSAVGPCYSLYSSDSEDQVATIHKGFDRCAALLNSILQTEKADAKPSCPKIGKSVLPKSTAKLTAGKGEKKKKKLTKKTTSVAQRPAIIRKTNSSSQTNPGFQEQQCFPAGQNQVRQPVQSLEVQRIPEASPSTCPPSTGPFVQPQAVLLTQRTGLPPPPEPQNSTATVFNCRLTTSTPTFLPPTPQKSSNSVFSEPPQLSLGPGGLGPLDANAQTGWAALAPFHMLSVPSLSGMNVLPQPGSQTPVPGSDGSSEYGRRSTTEDKTESVDVTLRNDTPVKDTSCQTSFEKCAVCTKVENTSPEKTAKKAMTVKELLGDLKAIVADLEDGVALRLVTEVEQHISKLPAMVCNTNIQAEIALALQPLRSENAQLRRRLRILNQQLMERERAEKEARSVEDNMELISLQSANISLLSQLKETQRELMALQRENQELQQKNDQLQQAVQDKEQELEQSRKRCEQVANGMRRDLDDSILEMKTSQSKTEAPEKEKSSLDADLQPRSSENSRLQQLTRSMAKVASDLPVVKNDTIKPSLHLALVSEQCEAPEKEGSPRDPIPDSIIKYLNTLEPSECAFSPGDVYYSSGNTDPLPDWSRVESFRLPEENPPKSRPVVSASEKGFGVSLNKEPQRGKTTTYVPMKETVNIQSLSDTERPSPVGSLSHVKSLEDRNKIRDGLKRSESKGLIQPFERMHVSKMPFDHMPTFDDLTGDFPTSVFSMICPSGSENFVPSDGSQLLLPCVDNKALGGRLSGLDSTLSSCDIKSVASDWSMSSWSSFNTADEQDFRKGLAALDASIASLQRTIQSDLKR